ncbi:MAG: hypothetical protein GY854_08290 [Deltaproteobacteria bacterium]|nr:hypothetical protein [Deltaproteobacteria bacterium]
MPKRFSKSALDDIVTIVKSKAESATVGEIERALPGFVSRRTLQNRLKHLVDTGRLVREGRNRWATYRVSEISQNDDTSASDSRSNLLKESIVPLSSEGMDVLNYLRRPPEARRPVGYDRSFLDSYRPNKSFYLTEEERGGLHRAGRPVVGDQPAGTFARQILDRLLIDLSWNSSRLEGNTYSLLDTRRLITFLAEAEGKDISEAQMILNHKDAIEFIIDSAGELDFDRYSILNLHALLANNLLPDPAAPGRLRSIPVGISESSYLPLEVPQIIEECFEQFLRTANAIEDPFEQSFFTMVQLPYLQPFDDVNKRVSRLAANIPLIRANLCPLSFTDVPRDMYTRAVLGVYEIRSVELLKNTFIWAYNRSADRYTAIRQSLGQPDPFRLRHRESIRELVSEIICGAMDRKTAFAHMGKWTEIRIAPDDQELFRDAVESEIMNLHDGNFARYRIKPTEFSKWQDIWGSER